jgi:AbrB family looped-hinge helix DNA binding protein
MKSMGLIQSNNKILHKEYRKIQGLVGESSFSVVLPKSFAISLGIGKGDFVEVYVENNKKIVLEKA